MNPRNGLGNMWLDRVTLQPLHWRPDCVWYDWRRGITLNAVGLSGPGARALLDRGLWQQRTEPFFISFMSVAATPEARLAELGRFVETLSWYKEGFRVRFGLQINISCPNVGLDPKILVPEARSALDIAAVLGIPLIVKISVEAKPQDVANIAKHPACDALCVGNTIKFGHLPEQIDWVGLFGTADPAKSPLAKYGGGGLSGPPLLPVLGEWLYRYRQIDQKTPISACGGIFSVRDALWLLEYRGANAIELGTVATLRPWRLQRIIRAVNAYFESQKGQ
ncbi:MAG: hypothetical protein Q8L21_01980 [Candidatus Komeilibacteria bacterium]|nr:hypothetical protein [Candidatus Komeilibacteria bacterium]